MTKQIRRWLPWAVAIGWVGIFAGLAAVAVAKSILEG